MHVDLFVSSFCAPCAAAKSTVAEAQRLVPALTVTEHNVASVPELAEAERIRTTPTLLVRSEDGVETFRGEGAPTLPQLLSVLARSV